MKIADFLEENDLSGADLAKQLGYTSADSVNGRRRRDEDIPEGWLPRLAELGFSVPGGTPAYDVADSFREDEIPPVAPVGAPQAPRPVLIDYASVAGYIEGAYKLSAQMAIRPVDVLLAEVIDEHAAQAGVAWAHWIESEPKVAALLQRLMIGTPLGEVIGVHVAIVFSYTLARSAARQVADDVAARTAAADASAGGLEPSPESELADAA